MIYGWIFNTEKDIGCAGSLFQQGRHMASDWVNIRMSRKNPSIPLRQPVHILTENT
jgi:hypothetical protein